MLIPTTKCWLADKVNFQKGEKDVIINFHGNERFVHFINSDLGYETSNLS